MPAPMKSARATACQATVTNGSTAVAAAASRPPPAITYRGPRRSASAPATGPVAIAPTGSAANAMPASLRLIPRTKCK